MSYQALYRAWRPETFSQIVGQDAVVRTLRHQVETGRVAHAYLFCGTRGTGKTTAAKVLARAINCLHPVDGDPCGECDVCVQLKRENSMDVIEIDAASNNGVDEIRDLREKVKYPPAVARYKGLYHRRGAHALHGAFNALLKTLEEPPAHAVFILATTEPQRLPATILSRCQRFDFKRLGVETMVERMMVVLGGIGRTASDEALHEIAPRRRGRDARRLEHTRRLPFLHGRGGGHCAWCATCWARRGANSSLTSPPRCSLATPRGALLQIDGLLRRGLDAQVFAREVAEHLRALLLAQTVGEATEELLECTPEDAQRYPRTGWGRRPGTAVPPHGAVHARGAGHEVGRRPAGDAGAGRRARLLPRGGKGRDTFRARGAAGSSHRAGRGHCPGQRSAPTRQGPRAGEGARHQGRAAALKARPKPRRSICRRWEALSKANPSMRAALEGIEVCKLSGWRGDSGVSAQAADVYEDARAQARASGRRLYAGLRRADETGDAPGGRRGPGKRHGFAGASRHRARATTCSAGRTST